MVSIPKRRDAVGLVDRDRNCDDRCHELSSTGRPALRLAVILCLCTAGGCGLPRQGGASTARPDATQGGSTGKPVEIPWISGAFKHVLDPPGMKSDPARRPWYINDHCFYVEENGTIHWFGITNPYPKGTDYYAPGTHQHIGHAVAHHPFGPWTEQRDALCTVGTGKNIGACWVARSSDHYVMIYGYNKGFQIATSQDLYTWQERKTDDRISLGQGTRDPCVLNMPDGFSLLYAAAGYEGHGAVRLARSRDLVRWETLKPALVSDVEGDWGPLESPFVYQHKGIYYLFVNHSHHQYQETLVFVSDSPYAFDWNKPLCTLFTHAAEIFEWKGKTYISHCGIEDRHWGRPGLYLAELCWNSPN